MATPTKPGTKLGSDTTLTTTTAQIHHGEGNRSLPHTMAGSGHSGHYGQSGSGQYGSGSGQYGSGSGQYGSSSSQFSLPQARIITEDDDDSDQTNRQPQPSSGPSGGAWSPSSTTSRSGATLRAHSDNTSTGVNPVTTHTEVNPVTPTRQDHVTFPNMDVTGTPSAAAGGIDGVDTGDSGSRLKNRTKGGGNQRYMPGIPEDGVTEHRADERPIGASGSRVNSYASNDSRATDNERRPGGQEQSKLTIEGVWKVERAEKEKQGHRPPPKALPTVVKWAVTIFMALILTLCLVTSKLSVLYLSKGLNRTEIVDVDRTGKDYYTSQSVVMCLYLAVPPLVMCLRSFWYGLLDSAVPWPHRDAVMVTIFTALLESVGLSLLALSVLGRFSVSLSLMMMSSLLLAPAVFAIFTVVKLRRRDDETVTSRALIYVLLGSVLIGAGLCLTLVGMSHEGELDSDAWRLAVAFVLLSVAWLPPLVYYCTHPAKSSRDDVTTAAGVQEFNNGTYGTVEQSAASSAGMNSASTNFSTATTASTASTLDQPGARTERQTFGSSGTGVMSNNASWKSSCISNLCRVFFVVIAGFLLIILDSEADPTDMVSHLGNLTTTWSVSDGTWMAFGFGLGAGLLAYFMALAACHMNMGLGAFAPPLVLTMPLCILAVQADFICKPIFEDELCSDDSGLQFVIPGLICLTAGHVLAFGWYLFRRDVTLLLQESLIFFLSAYNSVSLDTWLTVNRRHLGVSRTDSGHSNTKVFICTTMYREEENEMRQLLESIRSINEARGEGGRCFESHIIFDQGVKQRKPTEYALILISLLKDTLGVDPKACTKVITPYGMKLSWALPGQPGKQMPFNIHLKDNFMVKNKKRWSQVMYMSYVLDFLTPGEDETFILTTDADVVFTPDSVEALMDLMTRDSTIGAVCARTHPMGGGPLVWYQVFEYAIGHWFQKAAEHVLGSVLCAPGCFSVYRCRALADVLPKYARRVESAFDFLTKDMGEDRWLCTLLVQSGWRIEYCAASENSTNCPSEFEEFYKQRRRWIASTLANLMLIVKEWKYVHEQNQRVSVLFLLYQGLLLFSTLIGPSTIVLVVSGGLAYAWAVDTIMSVILQILVCVAFSMVCVWTTQKTQLNVAKLYTFLYAVIMTAVAVGTAEQIVSDVSAGLGSNKNTTLPFTNGTQPSTTTTTETPNAHISVDLPISVTTLYFAILVGIFCTAGLLHPREILCLAHGVWYLLCLPSGYLVLTIYSICNITDSSWGTREVSEKVAVKNKPWQEQFMEFFLDIFFCCKPKKDDVGMTERGMQTDGNVMRSQRSMSQDDTQPQSMFGMPSMPQSMMGMPTMTMDAGLDSIYAESILYRPDMSDEVPDEHVPIPVDEWLPEEMQKLYADKFKQHGFDSTLFIAGMAADDLRRIGVTTAGHLHYLKAQIDQIPAFQIEEKVPANAKEWLDEIGLGMYYRTFVKNHIKKPKDMEILKAFGKKEIETELKITKAGHIKRLKYAITKLRDPTETQQKQMEMRQIIEEAAIHFLSDTNVGENDFWEKLIERCLQPDLKAFGLEAEIKVKLADLRNNWLMILAVSNTLWLILISTLVANGNLTVLGANPIGFVFLIVFGFLFGVQFLAMLLHRLHTLSHFLARVPYRCGRPMQTSWTFQWSNDESFQETVDFAALMQVKRDSNLSYQRLSEKKKAESRRRAAKKLEQQSEPSETTPLVV